MGKASWNGYLCVGELTIPMRLYSGTQSMSPHYIQLHADDHSPITRVTKCKQDGKVLGSHDLIKAVERDGQLVEIKDADLKATGVQDKSIIVRQFSDSGSIDAVYYEKPYYMVPGKGGEMAYTLLRQAFNKTNKVAIATFLLYEKEHIGIISTTDSVLMLQQLRFADEIVPRAQIKTPPLPQPAPEQVDAAVRLMERYSSPFYIEDYRNEQIDLVNEVIDRRSKGLPMKRKPQIAPRTTPENEIMPKMRALVTGGLSELSQ
jgi:DNA end-binding protein Ku